MNIFQINEIRMKQTINSNRWTLEFHGLAAMLNAAKTSPLPWLRDRYTAVENALGGSIDMGTSLQLSLFSVTIPAVKVETVEVSRFNDSMKAVTKFAPMEDLVVNFYDYVNGSASAIMQLWAAFVGDKKTGAIGFKTDFVLPQAYFYVYGPDAPGYKVIDGGSVPNIDNLEVAEVPWLQKYEIWNLFPKDVALGEHGEGAEPRKVACTFAIDNFFPIGIRSYSTAVGTGSTNPLSKYSEIPSTAL